MGDVMIGTRPRPWRDYRLSFTDAAHPDKDVHVMVLGPKAGTHFAGEWTLDELIESASDMLTEALRRKSAVA
jgi:hypothetical protein